MTICSLKKGETRQPDNVIWRINILIKDLEAAARQRKHHGGDNEPRIIRDALWARIEKKSNHSLSHKRTSEWCKQMSERTSE